LLWKIRPDVVVEIGSFMGGSTLYLAHLFDLIGQGEVISVDITRRNFQVSHPRISLVTGDSASPETVAKVKEMVGTRRAMVIHDGDHEASAVLTDLRAYIPLVSPGSYLIVEDGTVDILKTETAIRPWFGPIYAIEQFLAEAPHFEIDRSCERYIITQNPSGYLKRIG
jgi:cephalosporin hydroxylase